MTTTDKKYHSRLEGLEDKVLKIDQRITDANILIKETKIECKAEKAKLQSDIKSVGFELDNTKKKMDAGLEQLRSELMGKLEDQNEVILQQGLELDFWRRYLENDVDKIKVKTSENSNEIRQHSTQIEGIDSKVRANNIVVEGLPEPQQNKDETDKSLLLEVLRKTIPNFQDEWITTLIRLGQERRNKKRPRPLLARLNDQNTREQILKKGAEIDQNDQNDNARRRHSLVKACYKLLLKNEYACSMEGSTITYNKKQYGYDMLNLLPESCTPFMVKTRETTDKSGLCFFSEHTFCSNFCPAKIKDGKQVFTSVEHGNQYLKVKDARYTELAAELLAMTDPFIS